MLSDMANRQQKHRTLGIDIGRVIVGATHQSGGADTSFLSGSDAAALATPITPGAIEAIAELVEVFQGRVWLVSKCGPRIQALTRRWLRGQRFYALTGVREDCVRFCLQRPDKREHCLAIGATHFVDDRLDVLQHLVGVVPYLYWFGYQKPGSQAPAWAQPALDWVEARRAILNQI